jgi:type III pantothenate kinase
MNLLFDIGNTRLKWGLAQSGEIVEAGHLDISDFSLFQLKKKIPHFNQAHQAYICCVASPEILKSLTAWLVEHQQIASTVVPSKKNACGIRNNYNNIEQLGADRWVAALGARSLHAQGDLIIIDIGTALTIDWLSADNTFEGGVILPGFRLMHDALVGKTAGIESEYLDNRQIIGKSTSECVNSGIGYGLAGAVERIVEEMRITINKPVSILLTGGGAEVLSSRMNLDAEYHPHLVLLGLLRYAQGNREQSNSRAQ